MVTANSTVTFNTCNKCGKPFFPTTNSTAKVETCTCTSDMLKPVAMQGWQCPSCRVIHAPHVSSCNCQARPYQVTFGTCNHFHAQAEWASK